jgi:hypothetical protein
MTEPYRAGVVAVWKAEISLTEPLKLSGVWR